LQIECRKFEKEAAMRIGKNFFLGLAIFLVLSLCTYAQDVNNGNGKVKVRGYVFYGGGAYEHVTIKNLTHKQVGGIRIGLALR
jgi:hypothetical protein